MIYETNFKVDNDILIVEIFGDRPTDPELLKSMSHDTWRKISRVAKDGQHDKLLVLSHARGEYPTLKAYEINSTLADCGVETGWTIAFVAFDEKSLANIKFAETVAVNRGFRVGVFANEKSARDWLTVTE